MLNQHAWTISTRYNLSVLQIGLIPEKLNIFNLSELINYKLSPAQLSTWFVLITAALEMKAGEKSILGRGGEGTVSTPVYSKQFIGFSIAICRHNLENLCLVLFQTKMLYLEPGLRTKFLPNSTTKLLCRAHRLVQSDILFPPSSHYHSQHHPP